MNTKLTLTIEQEVIEKAKKYAKGKERSLSDLIENYLKAITKDSGTEAIEITPTVKSLKGSFTAPTNLDYKKELSKRLSEKYLQAITRILIDTDIILDFFFDRKPFSDSAAKILSLCESKEITGSITPVIISNVYYLLRQTAKHEKVIEKLKMLISITEILVIDRNAVVQALNSDFKDFEDALQNYTAELNKEIELIVTRNTRDYKNSALAVLTPDSYLEMRIANC